MGQTTVPIKSAWKSKVNWTQVVGGAAMLLALFAGHQVIDSDQQAAILVVIGLVQGGVTWILKTFYTDSVHASSLP